ncbi:MAG: hypothetical protein AVDCRST_MAG93-1853 [uncultured Chloroflexia bacterium]|uniref:Uncharacterized protein n=1 Tax=uncultured Chloroflexia bacterium TaxID=1672391 RepID=A0A6J4ILK9_9CHLR|nr:MAG: hypothetical protein AVDCRST_MAG93-1853 [uncultured Chloroflexia bacterium]
MHQRLVEMSRITSDSAREALDEKMRDMTTDVARRRIRMRKALGGKLGDLNEAAREVLATHSG